MAVSRSTVSDDEVQIEKVTKGWGHSQSSPDHQLEQIWQRCSDLTVDVQALSHELHPSILDNLGLVTAVRSFCREVSEHSGAVVEFDCRGVPASLPSEVSRSLFRVVQEASRNAVKYSGQKHFEVRLQEASGDLELQVRDEGVGFDATTNGGGLGLISMAERVHHVNGTLTIDSHPNAGTRIHARVPLTPQKRKAAPAC
jgi:signal transduction histidine kinase